MFAALITIGTFIKIPVPMIPFTLQFLFTTLAGLFLGGTLGAISVSFYVLLGLFGVPVFALGGGISYIVQPSFGYLIGFIVGSYLTGTIAHKSSMLSTRRLFIACFAGLGAVYLFGISYYWLISTFYLKNPIGIGALLLYGLVLAIPGDILLCLFSVQIGRQMLPLIKKELLS